MRLISVHNLKGDGMRVIFKTCCYLQQAQGLSCLKKSLPLSSTSMKAGKSSTVIFQMASMPSSGYSTH